MDKSREIKIIAGREYQIRVRKNVSENDYSSDIILQGDSIIREICDSMKNPFIEEECYIDDSKKCQKSESLDKNTVGYNNIIMFTSVRGAGKTSVMRSFAEYLKEKASADKKPVYRVLSSVIEPVLFSKKESIVRFILSRLYTEFINQIEYGYNDFNNEEYHITRTDIADLKAQFRKCQKNIENITEPKTNLFEMDELDSLADIGFSADLRKNIEQLVDQYLNIQRRLGYNYQYVVIQIDDADLAMGSTYQICEDVKNYLNVKKLIILMAADYKQMEYAVYQEYISKYEKLISMASISSDKEYYLNHCHQMAAKYMEKAFPEGHRINLPTMSENLVKLKDQKTVIRYVEIDENGEEKLIIDNPETYSSAQSLLLHYIYIKTGIVFDDTVDYSHPIIPKTFRELTHLLKLLHKMEDVVPGDAFRDTPGKQDDIGKKIRRDIVDNISKLEEYFSDYWCPSNLSSAEERIMQKILSIKERNNVSEIDDCISAFLHDEGLINNEMVDSDNHQNRNGSIRTCICQLEKCCRERKKHLNLLAAIKIYYTIHLNKWMAESWDDYTELSDMANYIGTAMPYEETENEKEDFHHGVRGYFEYKMDRQVTNTVITDELLSAQGNEGLIDAIQIKGEKSNLYNKKNLDGNRIDAVIKGMINDPLSENSVKILESIMMLLRHPDKIRKNRSVKSKENERESSLTLVEDDNLKKPDNGTWDMQLQDSVQTIREIITSYDLQEKLFKAYEKKIEDLDRYRGYTSETISGGGLDEIYFSMFKELDSENNAVLDKIRLKRDQEGKVINKTPFYDVFYNDTTASSYALLCLTNKNNRAICLRKEEDMLRKTIDNRIEMLAKEDFLFKAYQRDEELDYYLKFTTYDYDRMGKGLKDVYTTIEKLHEELDNIDKEYDGLVSRATQYRVNNEDGVLEKNKQMELEHDIENLNSKYKNLLEKLSREIKLRE